MSASQDVRIVDVSATFRHSAGRLGSHFLKALRDEKRILGWRSADRVVVPPKDSGRDGEWIEIGPGARLDAYAPASWLRDLGQDADESDCVALVTLDGADTALLTRVRRDVSAAPLSIGLRLKACFADERIGSMNDFWFEPAQV